MSRTPLLTPEEMAPEQRRIYEEIYASRGVWLNGPFAAMLHQPRIADPAQKLGEFVRYHTVFEPRLSELAILLVARAHDCEFEWYQHKKIALQKGVPPEVTEAIRLGRRPEAQAPDAWLVYEFASHLLERNRVPDAVYDGVRETFGVVGAVELTALIGYYGLIAHALNAHQIALPAGVAPELPSLRRDGR